MKQKKRIDGLKVLIRVNIIIFSFLLLFSLSAKFGHAKTDSNFWYTIKGPIYVQTITGDGVKYIPAKSDVVSCYKGIPCQAVIGIYNKWDVGANIHQNANMLKDIVGWDRRHHEIIPSYTNYSIYLINNITPIKVTDPETNETRILYYELNKTKIDQFPVVGWHDWAYFLIEWKPNQNISFGEYNVTYYRSKTKQITLDPPYEVTGCGYINNDTILTADIINSTADPCFVINASNLTFNGQNHLVDGDGTGMAIAFVSDVVNVTIENFELTDWNVTIGGDSTGNAYINQSATIENNYIHDMDNSTTQNDNHLSFYLNDYTNLTIFNNTFKDVGNTGTYSIYIFYQDSGYHYLKADIYNNSFINSSSVSSSLYSYAGYENHIYNNYFENCNTSLDGNCIRFPYGYRKFVYNNTFVGDNGRIYLSGLYDKLYNENLKNVSSIYTDGSVNKIYNNTNIILNITDGRVYHNKNLTILYSAGGTIYDNIITNIIDNSGGTYSYSCDTSGTNIIGGSYVGGNFYKNTSLTRLSYLCYDPDFNDLCNESYSTDSCPITIGSYSTPKPNTYWGYSVYYNLPAKLKLTANSIVDVSSFSNVNLTFNAKNYNLTKSGDYYEATIPVKDLFNGFSTQPTNYAFSFNYLLTYTNSTQESISGGATTRFYKPFLYYSTDTAPSSPHNYMFTIKDYYETTGNAFNTPKLSLYYKIYGDDPFYNYNDSLDFTDDDNIQYIYCTYCGVVNEKTYKIDGTLSWEDSNGYTVKRERDFIDENRTSSDSGTGTYLYLYYLNTSQANQVSFYVQDENAQPLQGLKLEIYSYNPSSGSTKLIETLKTDIFGKAVAYLDTTDYYYKVKVYDGTTLLYSSGTFKITTSEVYITIDTSTFDFFTEFQEARDITTELTYDDTTKIVTLNYDDNKNVTKQMCLEIRDLSSTTAIAQNCSTSQEGTLAINMTGKEGNTYMAYAMVTSWENREFMVDNLEIDMTSISNVIGKEGLILTFLIIIVLTIIALPSPVMAILLAFVGLVIGQFMGLIQLRWSFMIALFVAIIIFIVKLKE